MKLRKKVLTTILSVAAASILFSGCGVKVATYGASSDNVNKLKTYNAKLNVNNFTATKSDSSIMCRMSDPIKTPNGETFEEYVENALIEELKMAGLYSKDAKITLNGHLNEVNASSTPGSANWEFSVKVSSSNGKSFTVISKKDYSSSFMAHYACNDMAEAFRPAVQKLISSIINHSEFKTLTK
ncbi:MAG: hypothetical protein DRG78_02645 [Epsilonproteobacteria bacterium]|nr:MAG: hypothetical protein DRG78_02645 [Campylobacterota bacterium]